MKIVQVTRRFTTSEWGGTETTVIETSRRLIARGHEVEILCPDALSDSRSEVIRGVPVRRFTYFYPYLGLTREAARAMDMKGGNLFSFGLLRALLAEPGLDVVHLHTGKRLGGIGRTVARLRRIPYVVTLHGGFHDMPEGAARMLAAPYRGTLEWGKVLGLLFGSRRVLEDADAVLCVGAPEAEVTSRRLPGVRVEHLPNGVDPDRFLEGDGASFREVHGIPGDARVLLCVGRIDPQKDQETAIRVLAGLGSRVHLVLVGHVTDRDYMARLGRLAEETGVKDRLVVVGGLDHAGRGIVDAYHAADLFLLPSVHEPFGIVVLEAWCAGLPVVASRVGGLARLVDHGKDGLLFEPGKVEDAVRACSSVLADSDLAAGLARAGRSKAVERYTWDAVTDKLESLYCELVDARSGRQGRGRR